MNLTLGCGSSNKSRSSEAGIKGQIRVLFVADFFSRDMIIPGGAERNDSVLIDKLKERNIHIECITSRDINSRLYLLDDFDALIIANFTQLSDIAMRAIRHYRYIIYEHDHKYIKGRNPAIFSNFNIPASAIINRDFYAKAHKVFVLSSLCKEIIENVLGLDNVINIGTSLWSDEDLDYISSLQKRKAIKAKKFAVLGSGNPTKGANAATDWCRSNQVNYDILPPQPWRQLMECLSRYEGLVFIPKVCETFNRLLVEAKMLDCKVITNEALIGAASEKLWKMSGAQLLNEVRRRVRSAIDIFEREVRTISDPDLHSYTVILTAYRRNYILKEQVDSIRGQTIAPKEIWVWVNRSDDTQGIEFYKSCGVDAVFYCDHNWKYFGRFAAANLATTPYIAIFDDDTIPGPKWIENCLDTINTHPGILGGVGVILTGPHYQNHIRVGWSQPNDEVVEVDLVGHAWFFKKEWLRFFWQEEPLTLENGEDIHFSYVAQKLGGIKTYVPPHPRADKLRWSSTKGFEYGVDSEASSSPEKHGVFYSQRDWCVRNAITSGWTPLFMQRERGCKPRRTCSSRSEQTVAQQAPETHTKALATRPTHSSNDRHTSSFGKHTEAGKPFNGNTLHHSSFSKVEYPLIVWNAPIFDPSGYADEARQLIKRVAARWPIRVEPAGRSSEKFAHSMQPDERQFFYSLMKIPPQREFIRLIHLPGVAFHRDPHAFCNIGRTVFETDRLPSSWVARCNSMDEIWVPTEFNAQAFRRSGVRVPLHVVPEGVDASFFTTGAKPLHIPGKGRFAFLSIFEWTFRKGWDLLLKAWAETFRQDEDVCLILRSYPIDAIESDTAQKVIEHRISQFLQETLRKSLRETAPIIVLGEQIPASQMPRLYAAADAFVLPSRGEGWGRPYIEAMACGLPVIGTRWGGNMAFMNDDNSYLLDINGLEEVDDRMEFPFYLGHRWASPSLEQLKTLMRRLFDHPEEARKKGLTARAHVSTYWTWERAGEVALERLRDISRTRNRKPTQSIYPDLVRKKDRLSVVWEGSQFVHHSLALVNREVCLRLADRKDVTLSIIPYESHQFGADADTRFPKLERLFNLRPDSSVDIHVRHQWPPNFIPPFEGHWVMIQPWEYGRLPREWIAPMSSLVDEIWVPSRHVWKTYVASGVPQEQVHIVPNGVDSQIFRPEAKPVPLPTRKSFKFLFVGGTIWRKGVDILLEAYRSVFHRNDDVTLIIKDMGQDSFYQGQGAGHLIRSIQEDPNAPEIVYLTDMYSGQQMPGLFTACDCLVHPYRGEGFGLPVLEAMACGLPVIVTAGGATDDFCSPRTVFQIGAKRIPFTSPSLELAGGAGWVLEPDVEDLKQVLRHVFENVWDAKTRAQRALEHVRNGHTWDHVAAKIAERIQCIAERPIRRFTTNVRERLE